MVSLWVGEHSVEFGFLCLHCSWHKSHDFGKILEEVQETLRKAGPLCFLHHLTF